MSPHVGDTRAGGRDDGVVAVEDAGETACEHLRRAQVSRVEVHLSATRLVAGKHGLDPGPLEHLDRRAADMRGERVRQAGDEERSRHGGQVA
jgi:hypothetical protein